MWCRGTEAALRDMHSTAFGTAGPSALREWHRRLVSELSELIALIRSDITPLQRATIVALVTTDVHNRDIGMLSITMQYCVIGLNYVGLRYSYRSRGTLV